MWTKEHEAQTVHFKLSYNRKDFLQGQRWVPALVGIFNDQNFQTGAHKSEILREK